MLLKVEKSFLLTFVRYKGGRSSKDTSRIPTSIGQYAHFMPGPYPKPPSHEEYFKIPTYARFLRTRPVSTILDCGPYKTLPDAYRKFFIEWRLTNPKSVHIDERPGKFYKDEETGQIYPVQNVPLTIIPCPQEDKGIWGGEAVIQGYYHVYAGPGKFGGIGNCYDKCIYPKFWYPRFRKHVTYSEVLNKYMITIMTRRAIILINQHCGLDNYLLENRACDLRNLLALKLKRKILQALFHKTLYPDDEQKREEVYLKYRHHLDNYTQEEIDWYGLSLKEACIKNASLRRRKEATTIPVPLKHELRKEYIDYLKNEKPLQPRPLPWYKKKLIDYK